MVGSGPASLTAAFLLARVGCEVTIFESKPEVGGVLRYGIPEFRLPKEPLDHYRRLLDEIGVSVRPDTTIGGALHIDDLFDDGYEACFVGTGALRQGARTVTLVSNWNGTSANSDEVELALLDGATIEYGLSVQRIDADGPVFCRSVLDENSLPVGIEPGEVRIPCDTTIFCVSHVPKDKLALTTRGLETTPAGTIVVDPDNRTTVPHVYAAGDVVTGPKTVVHAVAGAKVAVASMLRELGVA